MGQKKPGISKDHAELEIYHVSRNSNCKSILQSGLELRNQEDLHIIREPAVHFFGTLEHAIYYGFWFAVDAQEPIDIWRINIADMTITRDTHQELMEFDAWKTFQPIPAHKINYLQTIQVPVPPLLEPHFTPMKQDQEKKKKASPC